MERPRKDEFWANLSALGSRFSGSCLILGDFNMVSDQLEKQGGRLVGLSSSRDALYQMCLLHGLIDLGFSGAQFT